MRRWMAVVAVVVVILAGIGISAGAYRAGERNGIAQGIEQVQVAQENGQDVQVVHVVGEDRGPFFPGFFLFPIVLIGTVFVVGGIARGAGRWGRPGPGGHGPGPWNAEGRQRFEERAAKWHEEQHGGVSPTPAAPAS